MANFASSNDLATGAIAASTTVAPIWSMTAATATLTQGCLIDISFGQQSATFGYSTTDGSVTYKIAACTSAGTSVATPPTPRPTQPGWRASGSVFGANHTGSPTGFNTAGNIYYTIPINQRASYRWMPVPGSELYWPATNVNGLVVSMVASTTGYVGNCIVSATHTE